MKSVYLDNAATTPMAKEVIEVMTNAMYNNFGNPSSTHAFGRSTKALLENARRSIAKLLNCEPSEIIFTSCGTEADNMAIDSAVELLGAKRIITTPIEHHAVEHTIDALVKAGKVELVHVNMNSEGIVDLAHLEQLLADTSKKTVVSLMHANNEIGTLLPLEKVNELCKKYGAIFHSDTVQTMGHYAFDLKKLDIDYITCSAHKFHGPKGVGFLYVNKKAKVQNLIQGGSQERGLRGGTENIYGIIGLAKALELAYTDLEAHQQHVQQIKSHMIKRLKNELPGVEFHGTIEPEKSLYTVLNVKLPATEKGSMLLFTLDLKGVACSGGSACTAGATTGSHVLRGIKADTSRPNARFSFSRYTTIEEVDYAVDVLVEVYQNVLV
ncbi:MAG TPA: cysteine desulfurase family protein [Taishania sp.]|nr:cysteine desulfurase family protein [Taishania sp.]